MGKVGPHVRGHLADRRHPHVIEQHDPADVQQTVGAEEVDQHRIEGVLSVDEDIVGAHALLVHPGQARHRQLVDVAHPLLEAQVVDAGGRDAVPVRGLEPNCLAHTADCHL